jgi:integrase
MAARKGIIKAADSLASRQHEAKALFEQVERDRKASVPENTRKAYQSDWTNFEAWCREWALKPLLSREPSQAERDRHEQTLILYLAHMSKANYRPRSIDRALSGICFAHRQEKRPNPKTPAVRQQLRGIRNSKKMKPEQSAPILAADLMAMMRALHADKQLSQRDLRDRAVLLTAWSGCLRRSEIAGLRKDDVHFTRFKQDDGSWREVMTLALARSKTDQTGEGVQVTVVAATNQLVCPVHAMREWLAIRGGKKSDPVFSRSFRQDVALADAMPDWQLESIVRRWVKRAELKPENPAQRYTPHSLRAGPITQAGLDGMPDWKIMKHSRHASYVVFSSYIRTSQTGKNHPLANIDWDKKRGE